MGYGKSTMLDYDRLRMAVQGAMGNTTGAYKLLPKGSSVSIDIDSGTAAGTEFNATVEPDDGFRLMISYIKLTVPTGIEVNVIVTTDAGDSVMFANNVTADTTVSADDFLGLGGIKKLTLYAKVSTSPSSNVTVTMEYCGKQVEWGAS